ncbi:hypothetical protein GGR16_002415 [Chelatococcus caeni]|uniref:Dit-like phage tail protein N-terminal domain-containing protein n=1 Tax=Chelatococcus caeni TaxID=1348468 RepID=A0A840C384_9HYPH|nr:hypothetical protein [Chelatococcus caeni]MBB4017386.1 hypothetical protein [Chelatococcus caeni]
MSILDEAFALLIRNGRAIGPIMPHVVVQEVHRDDLIITDHPVERGAAISDHAFKRPSEIEMRCGWSNSTARAEGYVQEVYETLLALQAVREPFDVYTGKRAYENMLLGSLSVTTDEHTEFVLMVTARLREVIIADTQTTSGAPQSAQASPQKTAATANTGQKQLAQAQYAPGGL